MPRRSASSTPPARRRTARATAPTGARTGAVPLLLTSDHALADLVRRVALDAGAEVEVSQGPPEVAHWLRAPLAMLDRASAQRWALPPRPGVLLLAGDSDPAVWPVAQAVGAEQVLTLPEAAGWLGDRLTEACDPGDRRGAVVSVVAGRGGGGATTLACALAGTAARRGLRVLLVDGDPLGSGLDLATGAEEVPGHRWDQLRSAQGRVRADVLADLLPEVDGISVLSCGRDGVQIPDTAMRAVLGAGTRSCDAVVVDLPRHLGEAGRAALALSSMCLLVVPAEVRAVAAATRVLPGLLEHARDVRLVVRGPAPSGLCADDMAQALDLPLVGELKAEPGLSAMLERGEPPARTGRGPLAGLSERLLDSLLVARPWAA